jgi:hypothetical protein
MAKSDPTKEIEFHPDAMHRFERAVAVVAKAPPQHRVAKKKKMATKKRETGEPVSRPRSSQKINK